MKRFLTVLFTVALTARMGVLHNTETGLTEKYYNKNMSKVIQNAQEAGIPCEYWVRSDGVKCFGPWIVLASHPSVTRYTRIQTSLGEGIVLDRHTVDDEKLIDIAVTW